MCNSNAIGSQCSAGAYFAAAFPSFTSKHNVDVDMFDASSSISRWQGILLIQCEVRVEWFSMVECELWPDVEERPFNTCVFRFEDCNYREWNKSILQTRTVWCSRYPPLNFREILGNLVNIINSGSDLLHKLTKELAAKLVGEVMKWQECGSACIADVSTNLALKSRKSNCTVKVGFWETLF
jgi:hypothetical protein